MRSAKIASVAVVLLVAGGCGTSTPTNSDSAAPPIGAGFVILIDSLISVDGQPLPCCSADSGGVHITTTAGTLTFYAAAHYTDFVNTPAGRAPRACVQEVPSGSSIGLTSVVTLPDGSSYLMIPCTSGMYRVTLTQSVTYPDGTVGVRQVRASSGSFAWMPNELFLAEESLPRSLATSMAGATIKVTLGGHQHLFVAVRAP
jgi:hypothetical protein